MVDYRIEFQEKKKYNSMTRSVVVSVSDGKTNPVSVFRREFGSPKQVEVLKVELVQDEEAKQKLAEIKEAIANTDMSVPVEDVLNFDECMVDEVIQ